MARLYKVSEPTVSRLLAAVRARAGAPGANHRAGKDVRHADRIAGVLPLSALHERLAGVVQRRVTAGAELTLPGWVTAP